MNPEGPFRADSLGRELARRRDDVHLSQRRLGVLSGVSNTAISDLESGTAPPPHPTMLWKLSRGLATSGSGAVDEAAAARHYDALMQAAGYCDRPRASAPADAESMLAEIARDRELASLMLAAVRRYPNMTEGQRQFLLHALSHL